MPPPTCSPSGVTNRRAEIIVDTLVGSIAKALHQGEKVELRDLGGFRLRRRGLHRGRNPGSGDRVDVPSKRVAYFTYLVSTTLCLHTVGALGGAAVGLSLGAVM